MINFVKLNLLFLNIYVYFLFLFLCFTFLKFFFKTFLNLKFFFNFYKYLNTWFIFSFLFITLISLFYNYFVFYNLNNYLSSFYFKNIMFDFKIYYFSFFYIFFLITAVSLIYCLSYNYSELNSFLLFINIIFLAGLGLAYTNSLVLFFVYYECLLLPSFVILYKFSKTRRSVEAAFLMFFWTQFGAICLIFIFFYIFFLTNSVLFSNLYFFKFTEFEINFIFFFLLMGFGVKLPIWPFYEWLPKAHVEASTNFSIFLSGVLVKFAFFGFFKLLICLESEPTFFFLYPYLFIGLFDSITKIFYQIDIKKLIAFCTVAEMHWLLIAVTSGQTMLWVSGFAMFISHAIISTNSFLMVDSIARRFKTRLITEIWGLNFICPKLFLLIFSNCIVFLGFPGSLFFISEFLFFSFLFDLFPFFCLILMVLLYFFLATFFMKIWMNVLFSSVPHYKNIISLDVDKSEFTIFSFFLILIFWLGNTWQVFLF